MGPLGPLLPLFGRSYLALKLRQARHQAGRASLIGIERIAPMESAVANGAFVSAEKDQYARFIGLKGKQAGQDENAAKLHEHRQHEKSPVWVADFPDTCHN